MTSINTPSRRGQRPSRGRETRGLWHLGLKRLTDVVLSLIALAVLLPVMVIIALAIRATSPGPAIFRQTRVGRNKSTFTLYKFRTMHWNCDDAVHRAYVASLLCDEIRPDETSQMVYKLDRDPRITRIGNFLRRTSRDELPQLFNVLKGEMSLVGPRPMLPWEVELLQESHAPRFAVTPGISGLWQVSGRNTLTMNQALELDVEYVAHMSFGLDLSILIKTVPSVLRGVGAR